MTRFQQRQAMKTFVRDMSFLFTGAFVGSLILAPIALFRFDDIGAAAVCMGVAVLASFAGAFLHDASRF